MKLFAIAAVAGMLLTACTQTQCVQPDPVEPQKSSCWNKGVDCGTGIDAVNN